MLLSLQAACLQDVLQDESGGLAALLPAVSMVGLPSGARAQLQEALRSSRIPTVGGSATPQEAAEVVADKIK